MSRRPARCTEADIKRAIRAALDMGIRPIIEIPREGPLRVIADDGPPVDIARTPEPTPKQGFIYFIRAGKSGSIKIGFSVDPKARLRRLQTSLPHRLVLLATRAGTMEDESALHVKFAHLRKSGEWFTPARDLIDHIYGWNR